MKTTHDRVIEILKLCQLNKEGIGRFLYKGIEVAKEDAVKETAELIETAERMVDELTTERDRYLHCLQWIKRYEGPIDGHVLKQVTYALGETHADGEE